MSDDEPTVEELHCGVGWCGGVPTHPTGNCFKHQDREPNDAGVWGR